MIPTFPEFKNIEWSDRTEVEQFTNGFLPYSDFNFVSLWAWNTRQKMKLSQLHGNLVLLFSDYVSEMPFLSFIGDNHIADTVLSLIEYSKQQYQIDCLRLVPEIVASKLSTEGFAIESDENSHDYIISVSYLSTLDTLPRSANPAAYACQNYLLRYPHHETKDCVINEIAKERYVEIFRAWAKVNSLDHWELNEYSAFERFIYNDENDNRILSLYDGDTMIGFASYEILADNYAICHFAKANIEYKGIYDRMFYAVSKVLLERNIEYWNFEQDLGIPGLRQAKRKYKPAFYLKKYIVNLKANN